MSAGESAYDVARGQRDKAARLERSAALWEQGAAGEVAVARALGALPDGWVVLHDLAWPGRARANIDHVVIWPGGVFVVDAKNWTVTIEVRDQVLRQNGRAREDAVVSAAEAAIAIQGLAPVGHLCTGDPGRDVVTIRRSANRPRKRRTPWIRVVAALTFLALLVGGGLARPIEWGSCQLVDIVTPSPPVEPAPAKKKDRDGARKKERPPRDADRGAS